MECDTCRRPLGVEQLNCPRRNLGQETLCPYQVEQTRQDPGEWRWMLFVGLGISLIPVMAILIGENIPFLVILVLMPFLLVGLAIIGGGISRLFGRQHTIFNPVTGQTWQQTKIFGLAVSQTETSSVELIPWLGAPARILRYPASVVELYRVGKASEVFSTALLQLAAQQVVAIGQVKAYRKLRKPSTEYVLQPGEKYQEAEVWGELEKRLASVVNQANCEAAKFEYQGKQYPRTHRAVLCLEDVIRMVFEVGEKGLLSFQLSRVVGEEAVGLGLGEMKGKLIPKFSPGKNTLGKVSLDIRSVDQLHRDFWITQPEHARDLLAQIDLSILSLVSSNKDTVL